VSHDPTSPRLRRAGRDQIIEQALKHELRAADTAPVTDACLDHESFAAWIDGGLDAPGVAAAEAHVSSCARCRRLLATMSRTEPVAAASGSQGIRLWRWWLAPLAAGAAAVTLWMVVPQQSVQPLPQGAAVPTVSADRDVARAEPAPKSQAPPPAAPPDTLKRNVPEAKEKFADATLDKTQLGAAVGAREQAPKKEADDRADSKLTAEIARSEARAPVAPVAPVAPALSLQKRMRQMASIEIVSPEPSRRWRTRAEGTIERSADGGRTWTPVHALVEQEMTAGSSPAPNVCWIVGRRGLVLITVDGATFVRLPFPAVVDLVGVTATDGRHATVTTVDGRTFQTTDTGRTWRQQ
jgi:hypothetical protein